MAFFGNQPPQSTRLDELKRILQKDPTSRQFLALAEEYRRQGKLRDAIITLERGLQLHGTSVAAHVALGKTYQQLDRLEDATRAFMNALRMDRENLVAIRQLAEVYLAKGDKVEAIKKLKLYRGLKPGDKDVNELIAQIEAEVPALKETGASGVRPRPVMPPIPASPSSARRAALRLRAEPPRSGVFMEIPAPRSGPIPAPSPMELTYPPSAPPPPPDFVMSEGPSPEELYASTPALEKMWDDVGGETPGEDTPGEDSSGVESPPAAPEPPRAPSRLPEQPVRLRPASREILALTYEMPAVEEKVSAAPERAVPPPPLPIPAPVALTPQPESAPFEDVAASAPSAMPDLFDVSTEMFGSAAPPDIPVLFAPSFDEPAPAEAFDDPPTQPLFLEPPAAESRPPRAPPREMPRAAAPQESSTPAPPPPRRKVPARLRRLASRFPARSSVALEDLRGCLQSLVAKAAGIRAAVLTDMEGLPVLTVGRAGEKTDTHAMEILVAEMTSFLKNVRRTREEVGEGTLSSLTLVGERGAAVVSRVSPEYALILQLDTHAAIGEVRYEAARTAGTLRSAVG